MCVCVCMYIHLCVWSKQLKECSWVVQLRGRCHFISTLGFHLISGIMWIIEKMLWFGWVVTHSLRHLNAWSPLGGTAWGGLAPVALLEEVSPETGLATFKDSCHSLHPLCLLLAIWDIGPQLAASVALPAAPPSVLWPSGTANPKERFLL